jgi:hypothetical protein
MAHIVTGVAYMKSEKAIPGFFRDEDRGVNPRSSPSASHGNGWLMAVNPFTAAAPRSHGAAHA